jgi:hypothetical protein
MAVEDQATLKRHHNPDGHWFVEDLAKEYSASTNPDRGELRGYRYTMRHCLITGWTAEEYRCD